MIVLAAMALGFIRLPHLGLVLDESPMMKKIVEKEREGLECLKTGDLVRFGKLNAEDAVFVDSHGPASKSEVMQHVGEFRLTEYTMDSVKFVQISKNSGSITYDLHEKGNSHGHDFSAHVYVSSVWAQRGKDWVCLLSQETGAK